MPTARAIDYRPIGLEGWAVGVTGIGLAWYALLMWGPWTAASLAPICHHGSTWALHCPACYAALALTATGAAGLVAARLR
jgi:hypothetical protein